MNEIGYRKNRSECNEFSMFQKRSIIPEGFTILHAHAQKEKRVEDVVILSEKPLICMSYFLNLAFLIGPKVREGASMPCKKLQSCKIIS